MLIIFIKNAVAIIIRIFINIRIHFNTIKFKAHHLHQECRRHHHQDLHHFQGHLHHHPHPHQVCHHHHHHHHLHWSSHLHHHLPHHQECHHHHRHHPRCREGHHCHHQYPLHQLGHPHQNQLHQMLLRRVRWLATARELKTDRASSCKLPSRTLTARVLWTL